jgi:hypothetical protein
METGERHRTENPDESDNIMINAQWYDTGVVRADITSSYWSPRLLFARRISPPPEPEFVFGPVQQLSASSGEIFSPVVAVSGLDVHVLWSQREAGLFYRRSTDGGLTFRPIQNLASGSPLGTQIVVNGSNIFIAWRPLNSGIFFRRSLDGGSTFEPVIAIEPNFVPGSQGPKLAASESMVAVVWDDNVDTFFRRSLDGGAIFGPKVNLSDTTTGSNFSQNALAVSGLTVAVVWPETSLNPQTGQSERAVLFRGSTDGGDTFGSIQNLSGTIIGNPPIPQVAASDSTIGVVWLNPSPTNRDVKYRGSINGGVTFGPTISLSDNVPGEFPKIAISECLVHTIWAPFSLFYRRSTDCGITFEPIEVFSASAHQNNIAAQDSIVAIIWQSPFGDTINDIFFVGSIDGGANFTEEQKLTESNGSAQLNANDSVYASQVGVGDSTIGVVWINNPFDNFEVFFREAVLP